LVGKEREIFADRNPLRITGKRSGGSGRGKKGGEGEEKGGIEFASKGKTKSHAGG